MNKESNLEQQNSYSTIGARKIIITHNAGFHVDDVFGVATLLILLKDDAEVIRTRDPEIIKTGDYVLDTGEVYNEEKNRFDHHQFGRAGKRENGIYYASFGLIWKKFGEELCGSKEVALAFDKKLVQPIDAVDNSQDIYTKIFDEVIPYDISILKSSFESTWKEDVSADDRFMEAVEFAKKIIKREIKVTHDWVEAEKIINHKFEESPDKRIIVFNEEDTFDRVLITLTLQKHPEVYYAVMYKRANDLWQSISMNEGEGTLKLKKPHPESWRGIRGEELANITGVHDAYFCHNSGFFALAKSKEGAIELAKLALRS